jgi:hypothetical protein
MRRMLPTYIDGFKGHACYVVPPVRFSPMKVEVSANEAECVEVEDK